MSKQHKAWKPSPAAKPSHLSAQPSNVAALQGATLAFASSPKSASSTVQQLRTQYESDQKVARPPARSPFRGRPVSPQHVTSHSVPPSRGRASSPIAATLASASPSPGRSPNEEDIQSQSRQNRVLARQSESRSRQNTLPTTPNTTRLDLNTVPHLPPRATPVESRSSSSTSTTQATILPTQKAASPTNNHLAPTAVTDPILIKPNPPPPRKGAVRGPLKPDWTGPKQYAGLSREQAISRIADAMVASSLASSHAGSRAPSPTHSPNGRDSRRRSASAHTIYPIPLLQEKPPPRRQQRPMKQTLRKHSSDDPDAGVQITKRGHRHLVRKHPNMHHEGDRKRWRDKITEKERKRYEGVFAANRGLLLKPADSRASPSRLVDPTQIGRAHV